MIKLNMWSCREKNKLNPIQQQEVGFAVKCMIRIYNNIGENKNISPCFRVPPINIKILHKTFKS